MNQLWKPVRANILASLSGRREGKRLFSIKAEPRKRLKAPRPPFPDISDKQSGGCTKCHFGLTENQLEREELSEAFQDFQRDEELKDDLSHGLSQSGALLLQSPADPLHGHTHIIGHLKRESRTSKGKTPPRPRLSLLSHATCFSSCL